MAAVVAVQPMHLLSITERMLMMPAVGEEMMQTQDPGLGDWVPRQEVIPHLHHHPLLRQEANSPGHQGMRAGMVVGTRRPDL